MCGIGGRARLFADGQNENGKGIWVISVPNSATTTVVNMEFHDAKVPDQNGAGIRLDSGSLTLRNVGFYDNEDGILGGDGATISIENCEFARGGFGDGQSHNIYIGRAERLTVKASYFHHAKIGHNFKSRAKETHIEDSYFVDGTTGTSSYLLDFPNGGVVYMRGNLLHKGPNADNSSLVAYGFEGITWTTNTVTMVHNTFVSTYGSGRHIELPSNTQSVTLTANLFAGNAAMIGGGFPLSNVVQQSNFTTTNAANVPGAANAQFWPAAGILNQLGLSTVPDPQYVSDAPQPMVLRTFDSGSQRRIGALQAAP